MRGVKTHFSPLFPNLRHYRGGESGVKRPEGHNLRKNKGFLGIERLFSGSFVAEALVYCRYLETTLTNIVFRNKNGSFNN